MSTNTEALRGIRAFGPEHFAHLEGLIAERDQLLEALQNLLTFPLGTFQVAAAKAAIAKATAPAVQRLPADDTEGGAA